MAHARPASSMRSILRRTSSASSSLHTRVMTGGMRPWATSSTASASCCLVQYLEQVDHLDHQALTSLIGDSAGWVGARGSGRIPLVVLPYSVLQGVSSE